MRLDGLTRLNTLYSRAGTQPTIYAAACLANTLFDDVCSESGQSDIERAPIGDKKLPTEILKLCDKLNAIFDARSGEFTRSMDDLPAAISELKRKSESIRAASDDLERDLGRLAACEEELKREQSRRAELEARLSSANAAKSAADALRAECARLEEDIRRLSLEGDAGLVAQRDGLIARKRELEAQNSSFRIAEIEPIEKEISELTAAIAGQETERTAKLKDKNELIKRNGDIAAELSRIMAETAAEESKYATQSKAIESQRVSLQGAKALLESLRKEKKTCDDELFAVNGEIILIRDTKLPETKTLVQTQKTARDALQAQLEALEKEIAEIEKNKGAVEAELGVTRGVHSALLDQYTNENNELQRLKADIEGFNKATIEGGYSEAKRQLEAEKSRLESLVAETEAMKLELKTVAEELLRKQSEFSELQRQKGEREKTDRALSDSIASLSFAKEPSYTAELTAAQNKLSMLEALGRKLREAAKTVAETLGQNYDDVADDAARIGKTVKDLSQCIEQLRGSLAECAKTLNNF